MKATNLQLFTAQLQLLSTIMQLFELLSPKVQNIKWRVMTSQILTFYGRQVLHNANSKHRR